MFNRILIALAAGGLLGLGLGCEDSGGAVDQRADEAGEMAEEMEQQRLREQGYGPIDRQIYGEIAEERYELIIDTQEINDRRYQEAQEAQEGEEEGIFAKP